MSAVAEGADAESDGLRRLVDGLPLVVWEADARSGRFTYVSEQAAALLGHPSRRWLDDPQLWASIVHPDDREESLRRYRQHLAGHDDYEFGYRAVAANGQVVWLHQMVRVVRGPDGAAARLHGVLIDVSQRRAAEDRERFLDALERELQSLEDAEETMALLARRLGEHIGADRCAYARAEADDDHFVMSGDYATGLPHLPGRFAMHEFGAGCLRAMRDGVPWVVDDSRHDDRLEPADLAAYELTGIRAVICVPLHKGGRFVAAMAVHQAVSRHWTPAEIELVAVAANRCWETLQRIHASRALRDSEHRHRMLVERATDGIWVFDHDLRIIEVNPAACTLLGRDRESLLGRPVAEIAAAEHLERLTELVRDPSATRVLTEVWHVHRADGGRLALELSIQTTPTGLQAIGRDVTARMRAEAERELLLQREHEIAEALQRSLLPRELPALPRLAAAARYLPAAAHAQTGGDWYEVLPVTDGVVALSVGDVVGKGPAAAAVMGQLRSALAGYLLDGHSPAAALERLDTFAARITGAAGSTCACLTFDCGSGELRWAIAGHPPPLVVQDGQPCFLSGGGAALGVPSRRPYRENSMALTPGSSVLLYTDGLVERRGSSIDDGLNRLVEVVGAAHRADPEVLAGTVADALLDQGHEDDVAIVVVRHIPPPLHRRAPAVPTELRALRQHLAGWAAAAGLSADAHADLQLSIGEAVANAVEHAYPEEAGEVDYEVARGAGGDVHVTVRDRGRWRPEPSDSGYRGRGLRIIRAIDEHAVVDGGDDGTTVAFRLPVTPGAALPAVRPAPPPVVGALTVGSDGDGLALRLAGDLDLTAVGELRDALLEHVDAAGGRPVELDLSAVGYLSSSGLALLLEAAAAADRAGSTLTVAVAEKSPPARILALSGLDVASISGNLTVRAAR